MLLNKCLSKDIRFFKPHFRSQGCVSLIVGSRFASGGHRFDADQIKAYASQFDPQPFHLDEEAAQGSYFGQLVASGWHTMAITMKLLVESFEIAGGLIGAGAEISWPAATLPGETLHVETEIIDVRTSRSKGDRGIVTIRCETRNLDGELRQVFQGRVLAFRQSTAT